MSILVNNNGTYTFSKEVYIYDDTGWKEPIEIYIHDGTGWKLQHKKIDISSNSSAINLYTLFGSPSLPVTVKVVINSGVTISSSSSTTPALTAGSFPVGSRIYLVNNGIITGAGGNGGQGAPVGGTTGATAGTSGGTAILTNVPMVIENNGTIAGGGGGGGGGGAQATTVTGSKSTSTTYDSGDGGGGGAGIIAGTGSGGGSSGTSTTGGAGGTSGVNGGAGGNRGAVGKNGVQGNYKVSGAGGAAGYSISGISNVTIDVTGTILGPTI